jgi:hypothetical protein
MIGALLYVISVIRLSVLGCPKTAIYTIMPVLANIPLSQVILAMANSFLWCLPYNGIYLVSQYSRKR